MAKPPSNDERRYQGTPRANISMALEGLNRIWTAHQGYITGPETNYPNQFAPVGEMAAIDNAIMQLQAWKDAQGPIPNRPSVTSVRYAMPGDRGAPSQSRPSQVTDEHLPADTGQ